MHVEALSLGEVDDVELDRPNSFPVFDLEVEPLVVASGIRIDAHKHVELTVIDLNNHVQIS